MLARLGSSIGVPNADLQMCLGDQPVADCLLRHGNVSCFWCSMEHSIDCIRQRCAPMVFDDRAESAVGNLVLFARQRNTMGYFVGASSHRRFAV